MSGIVGIVHFDGAPVDRDLLGRMTSFLAFRGPDAQEIWIDGNVGFGHTLLKTTDESEHERQPLTLDGRLWIVADARVDARSELIPQLRANGHEDLATDAPDVELILRAYQVWGENCVEHLLGDFGFAIWDAPRQRLFCARDHMGVKPFHYAQVGNALIFSNTLDCIRQHPAVSGKLNELAIADFLIFGLNQDPATTTLADIQRLTPAHFMTWSAGGLRISRYWTLPIDDLIIYPRPEEYTYRFRELLRAAVQDRLRTNQIGVFMSGGVDSSALAATACCLLRERATTFCLRGSTAVYDRVIPDQERYYSGLVAKYLGIPIHYWVGDNAILTPWSEQTLVDTPEPVENAFDYALGFEFRKQAAAGSRVFLYGEGPDNALRCDWRAHLALLAKEQRWQRLFPDFWFHVVGHPRIPFVGRVRHWLQGYRGTTFPAWLNLDFVRRLALRKRWENLKSGPDPAHPSRPNAYRDMSSPLWQDFLERFDVVSCRTLSEVRHPYLDVRFVRFLLAVPAIPWCCNKTLSRRAAACMLPEQVIRRPKSPMQKDPTYERARLSGMPRFPVSDALLSYVNPNGIPKKVNSNIEEFRADMRAISFACWMRNFEHGRRQCTLEGEEALWNMKTASVLQPVRS